MRRVLLYTVAFLWVGVLFAICAPLILLWPSLYWRNRLSLWAGYAWARVCLAVAGIRVEVSGHEHLAQRPAIFTFNHTNVLDFFANAFFAERRCLVFGKRELVRLPGLGWGWWLGGHPLLFREDPVRWKQQFDRVAALMKDGGYSAIIAPEGHRSRDGSLQPFKKGAFHLAIATGVPIVPVVIRGAGDCMRGSTPVPGTLRLEALPPLSTEGWTTATLDEHVQTLRSVYEQALGLDPSPAGEPAPEAAPRTT